MNIDLNDPRLTAYALGELEGPEHFEVEALVNRSGEAQRAVAEIRRTAEMLSLELQGEPAPELSETQRHAIEALARDGSNAPSAQKVVKKSPWLRLAHPMTMAASLVGVIGLGVAASWMFLPHLSRSRVAMLADGTSRDDDRFFGGTTESGGRYDEKETASKQREFAGQGGGARTASRRGQKQGDTSQLQQQLADLGYINPNSSPASSNMPLSGGEIVVETESNALIVDGVSGRAAVELAEVGKTFSGARFVAPTEAAPSGPIGGKGKGGAGRKGGSDTNHTMLGEELRGLGYVDGTDAQWTYDESAYKPPAKLGTSTGRIFGEDEEVDWADADVISYGYEVPFGPDELSRNAESYDTILENPFLLVTQKPLSTFSIDVDTASYSNVRRFLTQGQLPPPDAVRIEELINYFHYDYPSPENDNDPFAAEIEVASCPWKPEHRLVRLGLKGVDLTDDERPIANLVFLIDVSGSMSPENKLPLVKSAMHKLVDNLTRDDAVAIVTYAGDAGLALDMTSCARASSIRAAIDSLHAGGSTNGGGGIRMAYETAREHLLKGGVNRVVWATDGDFNVGTTGRNELIEIVEQGAKDDVFLTMLGFGMGNLKDSTLEQLADKGNGHYAYIDTLNEAHKVLAEQLTGTLTTIAKDVKVQVEFNPAQVAAYRLIGYENRALRDRDFNDDTKDAGEIGAGHTVTALYEVVPVGIEPPNSFGGPSVDPLKYQPDNAETEEETEGTGSDGKSDEGDHVDDPEATVTGSVPAEFSNELLTLKLRYKEPDGDTSKLLEFPVVDEGADYAETTDDFRFAASVAAFGMLLRHSEYVGDATFNTVYELAHDSVADDSSGYRAEFLTLVQLALKAQ